MTTTTSNGTTDIREFGHELWTYLTGKGAVIDYTFDHLSIEVPQRTGADSPSATWKLNGTVRIRTADNDSAGSAASGDGA